MRIMTRDLTASFRHWTMVVRLTSSYALSVGIAGFIELYESPGFKHRSFVERHVLIRQTAGYGLTWHLVEHGRRAPRICNGSKRDPPLE